MINIELVKEIYGTNTYTKAVNTNFSELLTQVSEVTASIVTVDEFFEYYDQLFFDIPVSGSINSHTYLVEKSQQYIGGSVLDAEKQALIEEINSLRQQLLDLNQSFSNINEII
jgi:prefoldin subunit 5